MEPGNKSVLMEAPRPKSEPIVDRIMFVGIVIQSVTTTVVVLVAYVMGLMWHTNGVSVDGIFTRDENLLIHARTMAFVTLSLCEVLRAYTVRHSRQSVFSIGVFTNSVMQWAVGGSAVLVFLVACTPGIQEIFNCCDLTPQEWMLVGALTLVPAVVEEITKAFYRATGFGIRTQKVYVTGDSAKAAAKKLN
jgi:Ca2+-transporting ATPase